MLIQEIVTQARSELGDTYEGSFAYSTDDMVRYAVEGVYEAWRLRPSLQYDIVTGNLYEENIRLQLTAKFPGATVPLPDEYVEAIVYYVVHRCLGRDITDEGNLAVAVQFKNRFDQIVMR